jgi:hypothetical protein
LTYILSGQYSLVIMIRQFDSNCLLSRGNLKKLKAEITKSGSIVKLRFQDVMNFQSEQVNVDPEQILQEQEKRQPQSIDE